MPKPWAAFSPLTVTKPSANSRRRRGNSRTTASRPVLPTTSPSNRNRIGHSSGFFLVLAEPYHAAFGDDAVEQNVAGLERHAVFLLDGEAQADDLQRLALSAHAGDGWAIEIGSAAEPMPLPVIGNHGQKQHVGNDCRRSRQGRKTADDVGHERIARLPVAEHQRLVLGYRRRQGQ